MHRRICNVKRITNCEAPNTISLVFHSSATEAERTGRKLNTLTPMWWFIIMLFRIECCKHRKEVTCDFVSCDQLRRNTTRKLYKLFDKLILCDKQSTNPQTCTHRMRCAHCRCFWANEKGIKQNVNLVGDLYLKFVISCKRRRHLQKLITNVFNFSSGYCYSWCWLYYTI